MDGVMRRLEALPTTGLGINAPANSEAILYFISLRSTITSNKRTLVDPDEFQTALSEIVITFDPHAKEIGGPSFLSYAIGRLGPMNAAQAQLMAATLNYIIDSALIAMTSVRHPPPNTVTPRLPTTRSNPSRQYSGPSPNLPNSQPLPQIRRQPSVTRQPSITKSHSRSESDEETKANKRMKLSTPSDVNISLDSPGGPLPDTWKNLLFIAIQSHERNQMTAIEVTDFLRSHYQYFAVKDFEGVRGLVSKALPSYCKKGEQAGKSSGTGRVSHYYYFEEP